MRQGIVVKMKTKISAQEEIMKEQLKIAEGILEYSYLTINDAKAIIETGYKLLSKTEELRISRDSWRNKYEELKEVKK